MLLLAYITILATAWLLAVRSAELPRPSQVARPEVGAKRFCKPGECCEFKLRIYQRCIAEDKYDTRALETWPLFYDFVDKERKPIAPITRDYNKKACLSKDCGMESVGHILGPDDFYMRWHMESDSSGIPAEMDSGWFTYWFGGVDHAETERCSASVWSGFNGEVWQDACTSKPSSEWVNRTRMRETVCPFEC